MSEQNQAPVPPVPPVPPVAPITRVPQYGEYAAQPPAMPAPATQPPPPAYASVQPGQQIPGLPRRRHTWDLVLTIILLVLAVFGLLLALFYAAVWSTLMQTVYDTYNLGPYQGGTGPALVIVVSHLVLFAIAVGVSIPLVIRNKVAFWIPLTAGVIAAFFFWGAVFSDPVVIGYLANPTNA